MAADFPDYYRILQVHFDASPEVIQAAYRRLCKLYHPDENGYSCRMLKLNEAYEILYHTQKRSEYHRKWLQHFGLYQSLTQEKMKFRHYKSSDSNTSATEIMEDFFYALRTRDWSNAYRLLTAEDQRSVSLTEFEAWREAVFQCYQIQDFSVTLQKEFLGARIGSISYSKVIAFEIKTTETDMRTLERVQERTIKHAAFDDISWKVCLNMADIKQSTLKFRIEAEKNTCYDTAKMYHYAVSHIDPLTGLLSIDGFYNAAEKETARTRRYKNPLSITTFRITSRSTGQLTYCIRHFASLLKRHLRTTDYAAYWGNNQFLCLLAETHFSGAEAVGKKFQAYTSDSRLYTISFGTAYYNASQSIDEFADAAFRLTKASAVKEYS